MRGVVCPFDRHGRDVCGEVRCALEQRCSSTKVPRHSYFDDLLEYKISPQGGSAIQQERMKVCQKVNQQIQFIDDLANKRVQLPENKATFKNGQAAGARRSRPEAAQAALLAWIKTCWPLCCGTNRTSMEFNQYLADQGFWKKARRQLLGKRRNGQLTK